MGYSVVAKLKPKLRLLSRCYDEYSTSVSDLVPSMMDLSVSDRIK